MTQSTPLSLAGDYSPTCAECGKTASTSILKELGPDSYRWIFDSLGGGNGSGDVISREKAAIYARAFSEPYSAEAMRAADIHDGGGLCLECEKFYCGGHWGLDDSVCPQKHYRAHPDPFWMPPELAYGYLRQMSPDPEYWEQFGPPEDWR